MKDLIQIIETMVTDDQLVLQNGKLFAKPNVREMPGAEVLDTPEISIVSALGGRPLDGSSESRYSFKLNHTVCAVWLGLFEKISTTSI
jgi:hypothetical protein